MMILILLLLPLLIGVFSAAEQSELGLGLALLLGLLALRREQNNSIRQLQQQIERLQQELADRSHQPPKPTPESKSNQADNTITTVNTTTLCEPAATQPTQTTPDEQREPTAKPVPWRSPETAAAIDKPSLRRDNLSDKITRLIVSYFTDGNLFVRIGLLVLFAGVGFLLKYAAENDWFPIELRYLAVAISGVVMVGFGYRQRLSRPLYALLLQGGGFGIVYITIFTAYQLAGLLSATPTFLLLALLALITAAMAVLQNAQLLAIFGVLGGFLAPFLVSSGSHNYIALFGYYAVLNLILFAIAWFRAWRLLNLLGFGFTFITYALWYHASYQPEMLYPAGGFLLLFFLMYSALGLLYAIKQPRELKGLVDGTLIFGTPAVSAGLSAAMLGDFEYGIAWSCSGFGLYHLLLAKLLWQNFEGRIQLLAEAMLAIGVVFLTIAIPNTLESHWSSSLWALESAAILWVSIRQQRLYAQWFALGLQLAAGWLFILDGGFGEMGTQAWLNPAGFGGVFIALGGLISARLLYRLDPAPPLQQLHPVLYLWGLGWWLITALLQITQHLDDQLLALLLLAIGTTGLLFYLDRLLGWEWQPASITQAALLPVLALLALYAFAAGHHFFDWPYLLPWLAALTLNYISLNRLETVGWQAHLYRALYSGWLLLVVSMLSVELRERFFAWQPDSGEAFEAWLTLVPLLTLAWLQRGNGSLLQRWGMPLQRALMLTLIAPLLLWSLAMQLYNSGDSTPLPYLPLLNPLDIAQLLILLGLFRARRLLEESQTDLRNRLYLLLGGLTFLWVTALYLRTMHHYAGLPFAAPELLVDQSVQTGLSILWTLIGVLAIVLASRRGNRLVWICGAVLIGVVLLKLLVNDLQARGTIERIVSFLAVGGLLVVMGYFSPIPPKKLEASSQ